MKNVVIFRHNLFVNSETFIRDQAAALENFAPIFVARRGLHDVPPAATAREIYPAQARFRDVVYGMTGRSSSLVDLLRHMAPSVVHAHFGPDTLYAAHAARKNDLPLVGTLHGRDATITRGQLIRTAKPVAVRYALARAKLTSNADLILCVSDEIRRAAIRLGMKSSKLQTHYIGVDTSHLQAPMGVRPPVILHVARLVEKKGTADLISAFAHVVRKHADAQLHIVGDGPLQGSLRAQVEQLGLSDSVRFKGRLSQSAVHAAMAEARIFALPSVTAVNGDKEGLPISLLEAMAMGMAVVSTQHSGIPEAVRAESEGFLVAERAVGDLAERLGVLLKDEKVASRMGVAARERVVTNFDSRVQARSLEKIYEDLS